MSSHLVVFAKNPVPGEVKTRLLPRYSPEQAAEIYRAFILDTLDSAEGLDQEQRHIAFTPGDAKKVFSKMVSDDWHLLPQQGADLGERMDAAVLYCLKQGASRVVVIGTDIPSLPLPHLERAFQLLAGKQLVLGPSTDGGYYLVGLTQPTSEIFRSISWGTDRVFAQTINRALVFDLSIGLVPPWYDVDSPAELDFLIAHQTAMSHEGSPPCIPHTQACLSTLT